MKSAKYILSLSDISMAHSYYDIELNGITCYYNVSLLPYHIFEYKGNIYLFNREKVIPCKIEKRFAAMLGKISVNPPNIPMPRSIMDELIRLELVKDAPMWGGSRETKTDGDVLREKSSAEDLSRLPVHALSLNIAQRCNLKCVYCYGNEGEYGEEGLMDKKTAFRSVDWLIERSGETKKLAINFFGGEPLLNFPLMRKVVEYAEKRSGKLGKEIRFGITTNGTLLSNEIITYLKEHKISPLISFDGPAQDINRPFKDGQGSFAAVASNIKKLLTAMPDASCRATVTDNEHPSSISEAIKKIGFSTCHVSEATPGLLNKTGIGKTGNLLRMLEYYETEACEVLHGIKNRDDKNRFSVIARIIEQIFLKRKRYYGCGAGRGYLSVSSSGGVYPCHRFAGDEGTKLSNVFNGALDREVYQRGIVARREECSSCWVKYFCGGGCLYVNKAVHGKLFKPDVSYCKKMKYLTKLAIHLYCQLDETDKKFLTRLFKKRSETEEIHKTYV
ncbi:MAG: radical SAM protein [Candidatus Brocadiaceae bacterium]|nr:radical SAM protein [Candidatus Brocadiaceae bacterium]